MRIITLFLLVFLYFSFNVFSQNKPIDSIISSLEKEQLLFEKIFIHTNKTTYLNEDVIWYKVYVANNNNKPSSKTALVYVSLFSRDGNLIETKNVYIKDGVGNNQFELNENLASGEYFIQAHTNNMLNFGEQNKFITKITIGENVQNKITSKAIYDIQFFPEGGRFLENVKNTVGVKVLINGKGCDYKGRIVNSKNEEVALFSSMHLGMSKSQFKYEKNESYKAIIEVNDTILNKALPIASKTGVAISRIGSNKDVVKFQLLASDSKDLNDYVLLFHQNNNIIDHLEVNFKDSNKKTFTFSKEDFLEGVNAVSVLENNKPVLERKFFVRGKIKNDFLIERLNKLEDSIIYKLKMKDVTSKSNISLSVLSSNANYTSETDIASAMYLTPYVKGFIEKPSFYFNKEHKNREAYLDLLLLTQGWTQYSQDTFVNKLNPKLTHASETGFSVKGELSPVLTNNLGVFTTGGQLITRQFLNSQTAFSFNSLVAFKGDSVKLAFIEKEVVKRRPKKIKFDSISPKNHKLSYVFSHKYVKEFKLSERKNLNSSTVVSSYDKQDGVYNLETVDLETKKKSQAFLDRKAFDKKHRKEVFKIGAYSLLEIPEKFKMENFTLEDYLKKDRAYDIRKTVQGSFIINGRRLVVVTIDGSPVFPLDFGMPLESITSIDMSLIEDIAFHPLVLPYADGLAIFTNKFYKNGTTNNFRNYVFKDGYNKAKKYYVPLYSTNSDKKNQEIDWKPNLISNANGEVVFKLKDEFLEKGLLFSVQGFSNQGQLISGFSKLENAKFD
ncbi:hypothetical protein [Lacinutrix mariniflava]|uniref:hypothetical protein n=1 Tax=Lacinutrix mariniflava TaxID=342955 RepID=UPI0006E46101|nr:hypothetical protein [Lacinutrix mariniflava]